MTRTEDYFRCMGTGKPVSECDCTVHRPPAMPDMFAYLARQINDVRERLERLEKRMEKVRVE